MGEGCLGGVREQHVLETARCRAAISPEPPRLRTCGSTSRQIVWFSCYMPSMSAQNGRSVCVAAMEARGGDKVRAAVRLNVARL